MDPFEKAIRGAFEKSDPSDISVRRRVYRSALSALERALENNNSVSENQAKGRRAKLKGLIKSIEAEFTEAVLESKPAEKFAAAPASVARAVSPSPNVSAQHRAAVRNTRLDPSFVSTQSQMTEAPEPSVEPEPSIEKVSKPSFAARLRTRNLRNEGKKSRWPKFAFNLTILLILIFSAVYAVRWVMSTDLRQFSSSNNNDGNLEFTSQAIGTNQDKNWVTIFDPEDVSTVRVGDGAQARLSADGRATYLQISSSTASSATIFDVGLGILQEFMGKDAIIIIRAKTLGAEKSDMAVSCNFNTLGKCTRKRFTVTSEVQDFVFDYSFPMKSVRQSGAINIISDIEGNGTPLNLVAIQIREKPEN